ncbi:hypothetical protein FHR24_001469 [Wenyingzhuangia heitensis]|uniref:Uncharacterized protein n=1 Tax=Wenyingzhuangia heitensis TaxID=1487859 RepID=A0ABX0U860_9FLAO|nr:hypothetical protein [Wenyingzhuangia heitensis]NIJ45030.1 hypothetical protein [Wenyingzhuangia heitensis]
MNLDELSPEDKEKLRKQLHAEEREAKKKAQADKESFKDLTKLFVLGNIDNLIDFQKIIEEKVVELFEDYTIIKELKQLVYGPSDQDSHTSTLQDGSASITIGHNVSIKFNGNESAGLKKINEYLNSLASDEENFQKLKKAIDIYLKRNAKTGDLSPNKIIELNSLRKDFNSELFNEGLDIIMDSQIRTRNSIYVSGWKFIEDANGRKVKKEFRFTV